MSARQVSLLAALAAIWGGSYLLIKYALDGFSAAAIVSFRCLLASAVLYAALRATGLQILATRASTAASRSLNHPIAQSPSSPMPSAYKLVILFSQPADPADFERRWSEEFVPLADKMPGLKRVVVSRVQGGPAGPAEVYLIHELHFESHQALTTAMASAQGVAAGQCLIHIAEKSATLLFAEHLEDAPSIASAQN